MTALKLKTEQYIRISKRLYSLKHSSILILPKMDLQGQFETKSLTQAQIFFQALHVLFTKNSFFNVIHFKKHILIAN